MRFGLQDLNGYRFVFIIDYNAKNLRIEFSGTTPKKQNSVFRLSPEPQTLNPIPFCILFPGQTPVVRSLLNLQA
jgi:hypothetical protein